MENKMEKTTHAFIAGILLGLAIATFVYAVFPGILLLK